MKLTKNNKFSYGIGNLGYSTVAQTVNNFIMFFGTSVLGVSGTLIGLAIAISVFWDGISDPIVGYISDHFNSKKYGKRLGFLLIGTIGMVIFNLLLWSVPISASEIIKFLWILICLVCLESFCTIFSTPYVALGIDIASGYNEQNKLQGYKTVFFILGMVLPSVLMFIFMPNNNNLQGQFLQSGYQNIAIFTSILCIICGIICICGTKKLVKTQAVTTKKRENVFKAFFNIFYTFFLVLKKKNFSAIIIGYSVALISTAFLSSVGLHLFTYAYHFSSSQISILMSSLFISAIISQPFWISLANKIDKKPALKTSIIIVLVGILLTFFTFVSRVYISTSLTFVAVIITIFICGFGTGALYSLPISMYADCITIDKMKTGLNRAGIYSGFMTLAYNIANCIALFIVGVLLDLIKFNPSQPVQAMVVQNSLGIIVFAGCALSMIFAFFIFSKYSIKRSDVLKAKMKNKKTN